MPIRSSLSEANRELLRNNNLVDKIMHKRKRNEAEDDANKQRNKFISHNVALRHRAHLWLTEAKLWLVEGQIPGAGENDLLSLHEVPSLQHQTGNENSFSKSCIGEVRPDSVNWV
ncbi:hypothetical protein MASR1M36_13510 [Candidatus Cloacimonadaceae bacterium]